MQSLDNPLDVSVNLLKSMTPQEFDQKENQIKKPLKGLYQHYKGKYYEFIDVVRHSETLEFLAMYRSLYGDFDLWVRPLVMFTEHVTIEGESIPRFRFISQNVKDLEEIKKNLK